VLFFCLQNVLVEIHINTLRLVFDIQNQRHIFFQQKMQTKATTQLESNQEATSSAMQVQELTNKRKLTVLEQEQNQLQLFDEQVQQDQKAETISSTPCAGEEQENKRRRIEFTKISNNTHPIMPYDIESIILSYACYTYEETIRMQQVSKEWRKLSLKFTVAI